MATTETQASTDYLCGPSSTQNIQAKSSERGDSDNACLEQQSNHGSSSVRGEEQLSTWKKVSLILFLTTLSAVSSIATGLVTIGIPNIAADIGLSPSLVFWPGAVFSLASGCFFLPAGTVADIIGSRTMSLSGIVVMAISLAGSGVSKNGAAFLACRALYGIGTAMFLPTTISILTAAVPEGRLRNIGFGCLSLASPLGLQGGLLLAGTFGLSQGAWRYAFYGSAGAMVVCLIPSWFLLPEDRPGAGWNFPRLCTEVDWVGAFLCAASLAFLYYPLAIITEEAANARQPEVIAGLVIFPVFGTLFFVWMRYRRRSNLPALIPNTLWRNRQFTVICIIVILCWAAANSMDWLFSLYFQTVQGVPAVEAGLRFLPNVIFGIIVNLSVGYLIDRLPVKPFTTAISLISSAAPLIMALIDPSLSFWYGEFWAVLVTPTSQDVFYTVANIVITTTMPQESHALAGGVFNTLGMLGTSFGIAIVSLITHLVAQAETGSGKADAVLQGYRAGFWACFGLMMVVTILGVVGLPKLHSAGLR